MVDIKERTILLLGAKKFVCRMKCTMGKKRTEGLKDVQNLVSHVM